MDSQPDSGENSRNLGAQITKRARRNQTPIFNAKWALAAIKGEKTLSEPAQQFDVRPNQFGLLGDLVIGIIGTFIGDWLMPRVGARLGVGMVARIANAAVGAVISLLILRLMSGVGGWGRPAFGSGWGFRRRW